MQVQGQILHLAPLHLLVVVMEEFKRLLLEVVVRAEVAAITTEQVGQVIRQ
jgi:hypothetical protein